MNWAALRLRFDSPEQERLFIEKLAAERLHHFVVSGWIALVVYNLFLLVDWQIGPEVFITAVVLRLLIFTPVSMVTLLVAYKMRWPNPRVMHRVAETTVAVSGVLSAITMSGVFFLCDTVSQGPWAALYHGGFVPVLLYGNVVQRLRFRTAVWFTLAVMGVHWVCMSRVGPEAWPLVVPTLLFVAAMGAYTLLTNYRFERDERRRFLQGLRAQGLRNQLESMRQQLAATSLRDPLTGVANRRCLDEYLAGVWMQQLAQSRPLALLLIDVDHFKAYNDHYGHPAGDECLRYLADAFTRGLGPAPGLLARWGGEEFVIALPGMGGPEAEALAQGLVRQVLALALRHERSATASCVTVSIGVASVVPEPGQGLDHLLAQADAALYEAKREGRNRVKVAPRVAAQVATVAQPA